jgi:ribose transport system substrate-binding protein
MKSLANDFFRQMEEGAREHQRNHSIEYELTTNGIKDEQDVGKQIDLVSQMVAMGIDALVLAPADSKALVSAVKRAQNAGVVVVNIDNRLDPGVLSGKNMRVPYVGPSNRKGAALAASVVTKQLQAGDEVAIIEGLPTAANGRERTAGFDQAIAAASLKVVSSQAGNWDMGKANQLASATLNEHPNLKAFFCANDTMALGAVSALRSMGKLGQVKVVGFDNIAAVADLIKTGDVAATVDQHGGQLAVYGIQYALAIVNRQAIPDDKETPVTLVER